MINVCIENSFESWREQARALLARNISPDQVQWSEGSQGSLFGSAGANVKGTKRSTVPAEFIKLAETVACYDGPERWPLLYRILFRLTAREPHLLEIESDRDVRAARLMQKGVSRDIHKMHAFVRFRQVECDGEEVFVAWHEPQHFCIELGTPFFARRFGSMKFSILTPKGCAHWDLKELTFSPGVQRSSAPKADEMEDFWLLYYRSIYNPFRLKVRTMKRELPVRHWSTLPEAVLIPELIRQANHD